MQGNFDNSDPFEVQPGALPPPVSETPPPPPPPASSSWDKHKGAFIALIAVALISLFVLLFFVRFHDLFAFRAS